MINMYVQKIHESCKRGESMITFTNVTKHYNTNVGLENASVHINKGDFVFLVGPSGAGKSTFIKLILKEIDADSGSIKVAGREVTTLSNREVPELRRRIGIVFQDFRLLPKKTVYENVAFAMEILHKSKRQIRKKVPQVLSLVGISSEADKYPNELSAGEQQRVAIARAIINNPTVLIADEPTGNLDPDTASEIMDLLNQINLTGTTILMVTHAKDIVDRMQKRVVAIENGRIVRDEFGQYGFEEEGSAEPALDSEEEAEAELTHRGEPEEEAARGEVFGETEDQTKAETKDGAKDEAKDETENAAEETPAEADAFHKPESAARDTVALDRSALLKEAAAEPPAGQPPETAETPEAIEAPEAGAKPDAGQDTAQPPAETAESAPGQEAEERPVSRRRRRGGRRS